MNRVFKIAVLSATLAVSACAVDDPYRRTKVGAATGAVLGGVLGHQLDDDSGRYYGAAAGAILGGALGNYMDRQEQAFQQALSEEQRRYNLEIQRLQDGSLKLDIPAEVSFDFNSAAVKPAFYPTLDKVASILRDYPDSNVRIIGHTDRAGSDSYNFDLSQRRASSVAQYLAARGVSPQRLYAEGRGEREPRVPTADGVAEPLNRRVEMIIQPTGQARAQGGYPQQEGGGYYQEQPPAPRRY